MEKSYESASNKALNLLENAIFHENAKMGNIQIFNPEEETLHIIAQKGFDSEFLEHFKIVRAFDTSTCGRAAGVKGPITVNDVYLDIAFTPHRKIAKRTGFRSVKSVPIIGKGNKVLGVLSTHYEQPKWDWKMNNIDDIVKELSKLLHLHMEDFKASAYNLSFL